MPNLDTLPKEILHEINSYMGPSIANLAKCVRVCKGLSEVANAALYHHVDLTRDEKFDEKADAKTEKRQKRLLTSIADNPRVGALVRTFKNYNCSPGGELGDVTTSPDLGSELLIRAARNMTQLTKASLTSNVVAAHIIDNLPSYPHLVDLHVYGFRPEEHIWAMAPNSLRKLKWIVPTSGWGSNRIGPTGSIMTITNLVASTCPKLEELDIVFSEQHRNRPSPEVPSIGEERVQLYAQSNPAAVLPSLKHLGIKYANNENVASHQKLLEDLVQQYSNSLVSITIPFGHGSWSQDGLDHIMRVCNMVPGLKTLTLSNSNHIGALQAAMTPQRFFRELCSGLASPRFEIERLSIVNITCSYSRELADFLAPLRSLKHLTLGDGDMNDGRFGDDGRPKFDAYKPEILDFIEALPQSLEELLLELNGPDLSCDDNEDFDVMCDMGPRIFTTLRRLRSCELHAWISNTDGGLGWIPEKCIFHRRLRHDAATMSEGTYDPARTRDLWTSRMDSIYQEDGALITATKEVVELPVGDGVFEGDDAEEAWLGGMTTDESGVPNGGDEDGRKESGNGLMREEDGDAIEGMEGLPDEDDEDDEDDEEEEEEEEEEDDDDGEFDYTWPFWVNKLAGYQGFRRRHE